MASATTVDRWAARGITPEGLVAVERIRAMEVERKLRTLWSRTVFCSTAVVWGCVVAELYWGLSGRPF